MIVADRMFWRLVWKEYRAQRNFWLAIAGAAVGLMPLMMWLLDAHGGRSTVPWMIALALPTLFALGSSAVAFASETEEGTTDLLRIMAARTSRVFWGKIVVSLAGTAAMWAVLLPIARIATWPNSFPANGDQPIAGPVLMTIVFTMQLLAWGFFFSLICNKVLTAVCLTGVVSPLSAVFAHALIQPPAAPSPDVYAFLLFVPPLAALSYLLTARTMSGQTLRQWLPARTPPAVPAAKKVSKAEAATLPDFTSLARLAAIRETAPPWRRLFTRLVWLEFRAALSLGHVLWLVGLFLLTFLPFGTVPSPDPIRPMSGVVFSSLLAGIWMFQAEGGKRTRFLADHGLSPQVVWFSKHFVWGLLTLAVAVPFLVGVAIANHVNVTQFHGTYSSVYHTNVPGATAVSFVATLACLAYAVGQFASMLIPRAITAGFIACVLGTFLSLWTWLMVLMRVPLALTALPVFVILLATTLAWSRNWLLELATGRSWLRLAAALVASAATVWGAIGLFRVYEVPRPEFVEEMAPFREAQGRPITAEEAATADLYRQALAQIKWGAMGPGGFSNATQNAARTAWEQVPEAQRQWLGENQEALTRCLRATERPTCAFNNPTRPLAELQGAAAGPELPRLAFLILLSARELESAGKLDDALQRYVAALRMARHAAGRGTVGEWGHGVDVERLVAIWIPAWAAHPDQTAERINEGLRRTSQEIAQFPKLHDALLTQQFMIHRALRDDWSQLLPRQNPQAEAQTRTGIKVVDVCGPWERARAFRALELFEASQLNCVDLLEKALESPEADMQREAELAVAAPIMPNESQVVVNRRILSVRGHRSGAEAFFDADAPVRNPRERIPWNWLNTTPLLMEIIPPDHSHLWQYRLQRELVLRVMNLRLRLAAFKKANGDYPGQLSLMSFGMDAVDPYTGAEFGYFPHGYQSHVRVMDGLTHTAVVVESGTPILWSAGRGNVRIFTALSPSQELHESHSPQMLLMMPWVFTLP